MKKSLIGVAAGAIGAAMLNGLGAHGVAPQVVHRVSGNTKRGRQMVSAKTPHNRSKYVPHAGKKEQARALRCYMVSTFPNGTPRSAPVMHQSNDSFSTYPF